jgi:GNAT superfamily N-acetyltransferase
MTASTRRLEELSLNSSASAAQIVYDGWLVRLLPGKAKRARCVNVLHPSTLALDGKIERAESLYGAQALPALFRITPFADAPALDARLADRGYLRFDETCVESAAIDSARLAPSRAASLALEPWAGIVAALRGSPALHRQTHVARLESMPLAKQAVVVEEDGEPVAAGLAIVEGDMAGLFDIVTRADRQRRGHAREVVAALLAWAHSIGARGAYLQVDEGNNAARGLYAQFGFEERYRYWYRGRPGETK